MTPGDVVEAVVTRVEAYGLYLEHDGATLLVLAPDVSEERPLDLGGRYRPGDRARVRIVRFVDQHGVYKGAMVDDPPSEGPGG